MFSVVPTKILYDSKLTPQAKMALIVIYERAKTNKINLKHFDLANDMKYVDNEDRELVPSQEYLDKLIEELITQGYIKRNNNTLTLLVDTLKNVEETKPKKQRANPHLDDAKQVLEYLSNARIERGHSKRPLTSKAFIDMISARLKEGGTLNDCIMVINYAFNHNEWLKGNEKYLLPPTLFNRTNFAKYLSSAEVIDGILDEKVTSTGFTKEEEMVEEGGDVWVV